MASVATLVFGFHVHSNDFGVPNFLLYKEGNETYDMSFDYFISADLGLPNQYEKDIGNDEYLKRRAVIIEAEKVYPVTLVASCGYDEERYILSIPKFAFHVSYSDFEFIKPERLIVPQEKIDALKVWCEKHDVEWKEPTWILLINQ